MCFGCNGPARCAQVAPQVSNMTMMRHYAQGLPAVGGVPTLWVAPPDGASPLHSACPELKLIWLITLSLSAPLPIFRRSHAHVFIRTLDEGTTGQGIRELKSTIQPHSLFLPEQEQRCEYHFFSARQP